MRSKSTNKKKSSERRQKRVRQKIQGTPERPRLSVYRSLGQIYAQLIDDLTQKTLLSVSSLTPELVKELTEKDNKNQMARKVGLYLAKSALEKGIVNVVFDRNRYIYHGRVKALAEGAREGGLKF
ncbi:MAG: 50S ribosomal protein L18 [candidate division Zixibacteria bacterium RBG_16_43_9]|nr:MAG: 50S ribosomal protein L18 [candidate division Zixibacteria bacterium RBG_16_43_9]